MVEKKSYTARCRGMVSIFSILLIFMVAGVVENDRLVGSVNEVTAAAIGVDSGAHNTYGWKAKAAPFIVAFIVLFNVYFAVKEKIKDAPKSSSKRPKVYKNKKTAKRR